MIKKIKAVPRRLEAMDLTNAGIQGNHLPFSITTEHHLHAVDPPKISAQAAQPTANN